MTGTLLASHAPMLPSASPYALVLGLLLLFAATLCSYSVRLLFSLEETLLVARFVALVNLSFSHT